MPAQIVNLRLLTALTCAYCCLFTPATAQTSSESAPQLSKLDSHGEPLPLTAQEWDCVKDEQTGLVWEKKDPSSALHGQDTFIWYQPEQAALGKETGVPRANPELFGIDNTCYGYRGNDPASYCNTSAYSNRVNQSQYCGFSDWRLPSAHELLSLVDPQLSGNDYLPSIDTDFFPFARRFAYWTSTLNEVGNVIGVFADEILLDNLERTDYLSVRLVRGEPLQP